MKDTEAQSFVHVHTVPLNKKQLFGQQPLGCVLITQRSCFITPFDLGY